MTGRDLMNMLMDVEDLDAECVIFSDEEQNDMITEVEVEVQENAYEDEDEDFVLKPGTILIIPTKYGEW